MEAHQFCLLPEWYLYFCASGREIPHLLLWDKEQKQTSYMLFYPGYNFPPCYVPVLASCFLIYVLLYSMTALFGSLYFRDGMGFKLHLSLFFLKHPWLWLYKFQSYFYMIPFMSLIFLYALYIHQMTAELLLWMVLQAMPCIHFAEERASEEASQRLCCSVSMCFSLPPVPSAAHVCLCSSRIIEDWAEARTRKTYHSLLDLRLV